jgi:hypothetical protein
MARPHLMEAVLKAEGSYSLPRGITRR